MTEIPILNGVYTDIKGNVRTSYPKNLIPVAKSSGVSSLYLRPADGADLFVEGPGNDRGGINWNNELYRVMGTKLVKISEDGQIFVLGDVGGSGPVVMDYSFTHLGIASSGNLWLWDGGTLQQVTDPDLGFVKSMLFIDGYWMTTDGEYLVVTELNDPFSVNPLKYGGSIADPDPIMKPLRLHGEVIVVNKYTIETFRNIGGSGFPFQVVDGSLIEKGAVGPNAACIFMNSVAFVGSGRGSGGNESPSVYLGLNGNYLKIATREIDQILSTYSSQDLEGVEIETMIHEGLSQLRIHLPDRTLVYDSETSKYVEQPVWFTLSSSIQGVSEYRLKHLVNCYNQWFCGDTSTFNVGKLTSESSLQFGDAVEAEWSTVIIYNKSKGAIFKQLELSALTGRCAQGEDLYISTSYSTDGLTWSQDKFRKVGNRGQYGKRINWFTNGFMREMRIQRFRWPSSAHLTILSLEVEFEGLNG